MCYGTCGGYCEPVAWDKKDRQALLKEQKMILEAKLATINHWMENLDSDSPDSKSDTA